MQSLLTAIDNILAVVSVSYWNVVDNPLSSFTQASRIITPEQLGATGKGLVDDTAALQAADALALANNWIVKATETYLVLGALTITADWEFSGWCGGARTSYLNQPGSLILSTSQTVTQVGNSSIKGCYFQAQNLTAPTSFRNAVAMANAFAGTAVTMTGQDPLIEDCFFAGFNLAIYANGTSSLLRRPRIRTCCGDCNQLISVNTCADIFTINDAEAMCYMTEDSGHAYVVYTITNVANNGVGLIRITTSGNTSFATGDLVWGVGIVGATEANGRWTATVINPTTIDLQGSTFTSAYVSGGQLWGTSNTRPGPAFHITNGAGGNIKNSYSFHFDVGLHLDAGVSFVDIQSYKFDSKANLLDPTTIGVLIDGAVTGLNSITGGYISSAGTSVVHNTSGTNHSNLISNVMLVSANSGNVINAQSGYLQIAGGQLATGAIAVGASGNVLVSGVFGVATTVSVTAGGNIDFIGSPGVDNTGSRVALPGVAGEVWNNGGTVSIS